MDKRRSQHAVWGSRSFISAEGGDRYDTDEEISPLLTRDGAAWGGVERGVGQGAKVRQ